MTAARALLAQLGAPPRLLRHVALVGEASELVLEKLKEWHVPVNADFVRVGIVLHDAGKALFPAELDAPGSAHEPAGEALLLQHGVSSELARVCVSHARWAGGRVVREPTAADRTALVHDPDDNAIELCKGPGPTQET